MAAELRNNANAPANKEQHETMSQKTESNRSLYKQDETIAASPSLEHKAFDLSKPASVGSQKIRSKEHSIKSVKEDSINFVTKADKD